MKFNIVNKLNITILYKLNKELSIAENQSSLFSAKIKDYKKAFITPSPIVFEILIYKKNKPIGFIIYIKKFATYLASNVLYIEDIFLKEKYQTKKNINKVLEYIINKSCVENYTRVELRVLNNYSLNKNIIKLNGFNRIKKWSIYRLQKKI